MSGILEAMSGVSLQGLPLVLGVLAALLGALTGLYGYLSSQRWKRAEWLATEMKDFYDDIFVWSALTMIDYPMEREVIVMSCGGKETKKIQVDDVVIANALRSHESNVLFAERDLFIRDTFDHFLSRVSRFDHFVSAGLVKDKQIFPYIKYWSCKITHATESDTNRARLVALKDYIDRYDFSEAKRLISVVKCGGTDHKWSR